MNAELLASYGAMCALKMMTELTGQDFKPEDRNIWFKKNYPKYYVMAQSFIEESEGVEAEEEPKIITLN